MLRFLKVLSVEDNYVKFGTWSADTPDVYVGYSSYSESKTYTSLNACQTASDYNDNCTHVSRAGKDMYWRIIRINGDGSVRIIYDGDRAYGNGIQDPQRLALNDVAWNKSNYNDAKYVGYMYGGANGAASNKRVNLGAAGYANSGNAIYNQTNSNIKKELESWYAQNIKAQGLDDYVSDEIFCYDRTTPGSAATGLASDTGLGYGTNITAYGAYARLYQNEGANYTNPKPQFTCSDKNDSFTKSETEKGNGKLSEKVGLITADEVIAAGSGRAFKSNRSYYLNKGLWYWTGSPYNNNDAHMFYVYSYGNLTDTFVDEAGGVAPVINLSAEYFNTLIGDGTIGNEFREE